MTLSEFPVSFHDAYTINSPLITVTACPPSITRSPCTHTFTTPPRADA